MELEKEITELHKNVGEFRTRFEQFEKGIFTKADFKEFEEKIGPRISALETVVSRPALQTAEPGDGEAREGAAEYKHAFFNCIRTGKLQLDQKAAAYATNLAKKLELKALVEDATGQILVPYDVDTEIYRTLGNLNIMRPLCAVRTTTRDRLQLRGVGEVTVGWGKLETGAAPPESTLVPVELWQYVEDLEGETKVGKDELMDSDVSLEALINERFARALAEAEEYAFIRGLGHASQQPAGIILAASGCVASVTDVINVIDIEDTKQVMYTIAPQYRANGAYIVHSATELALSLLRDAALGTFSWQPSVAAGKPNTLNGKPIYCSDYLHTLAEVNQPILMFGDFKSGYRILDRMGMTIQIKREVYASAGLVGFQVSRRVGGSVINPLAIAVMSEHA